MKFIFTEIKEFDAVYERKRIDKCFSGSLNKKLHLIVNLFCDEKFQECLDTINSLGYDKKVECDEKEYLSIFISDSMHALCNDPNLIIKRLR